MLIFATCFEMHKKYDGLMDKGMDTQVGKCVISKYIKMLIIESRWEVCGFSLYNTFNFL